MNHTSTCRPLDAGTCTKQFCMHNASKSRLMAMLCSLLIMACSLSDLNAQIAQRGTSTTATNSGTNITSLAINKPTGVVAGDVLIVSIVQNETDNDNGGLSNATASGWTLVDGRIIRSDGTTNGSNAWHGTVLYRVADATDGSSYTFNFSTSNGRPDMAIGSIVAFSGVDGTGGLKADGTSGGPFDIDPGTLNLTNAATSTATGVTTNTANCAVVMLSLVNNDHTFSSWAATNPASLTELYENTTTSSDDAAVGAAWALRSTAGATGNGTVTLSASGYSGAMFLVLEPCVVTASAGAALNGICRGGTSAALGGSVGGSATGGTWSDGGAGGSFNPNASTLNATYTPAANYTGTITLTLTATGSACGTASASKTLVVSSLPVPTAAVNSNSICGSGTVNLTGSVAGATPVNVAVVNFENSATYTASGGSTKTGTSTSSDRPASVSFVGSPTTSYWVNNGTATVTTSNFTGLSADKDKTVSLRLASFSIGSTSNGADNGDYVRVAISLDGGSTYSTELEVNGGSTGNSFWGFSSGTGVASVTYDGNNSATVFAPAGGGNRTADGYSLLKINLPANSSQVRVRVTMLNSAGAEAWIIDDIIVEESLNISYAWTSDPSGFTSSVQNPSGVSVAAATTYTLTATNTTTACFATDTVQVVVQSLPDEPSANSVGRCGTGTVTLTATVDSGETIDWYAASSGGSPLAGGTGVSSFTTPTLSATTVYHAQARNTTTGCVSASRTEATASISTSIPVTPGAISGSAGVCAGISGNSYSISAVSGATGYTWSVPTGWTISAGQNTNSATITSGTARQNGNISVTANNACGNSAAASVAVTVQANTWNGTQGTNWNTPGNWSCGTVPAAGSDIVISPTAANTPVISSNVTIAGLDIAAGKTFELNGATVTINGAVTGEGSLTGSHTSSLVLNGNTGSLRFTQSGTGNFLKDLTINNGATASLANALNITGGTSANSEGTLTVNGTGVLTTNGHLTIKSNSFGTARIAANSTSNSYVSGAVTVERFIPKNTYKGWRLLGANTNGQTINQAWQEGQSGSTLNNTPGFGTMITGPAATDSVARTLGFDQKSVGYSMFRYDSESDALLGITNTNNTQLNAYSGYFLFIRGDRSPNQFGSNSLASTSTVLRSKGNLNMGTQASITINPGRFVLASNPYASAIDMRTVMATRSNSSISQSFQVWDPKLQGSYGFGAYQTLDYNPLTGNYEAAPGGGSFNTNNPTELNFIQSGSAFFIQNTGQSQGTITIAENAKAAGSRNTFRPTGNLSADVKFRTNLFAINANSVDLADGSIIRYADAFSNAVDSEDVVKNTNFGENFGLFSSGTELAVERRQLPSANDTIFYKMYSLKRIAYRIEFTPVNMPAGMEAFLEDAFTNTSTPVSLTDTSSYTFTVSTVAASAAQNRFRIVFRPQIALPVTVTEVKAYQQNNRVTVAWTVSNQTNLREYRVERSADGRNFSAIGTVAARNTAAASINYQFDDAQALSGWNYYRIQCVDNDGRFKYTVVVKVMTGKAASSFTVYPNPVEGSTMNLQLVNQSAGRYTLRLLDAEGRTVMTARLEHAGGNATQSVALPGYVANGRYQLEIVGSENAPASVIPVLVRN